MRKIQILFSWIMVVGLLLFVANCGRTETKGFVGQSQKAPDFNLPSVDGGTLSLSDFKGQVIILDFWATWCPPCVKEIPDFVKLYNKYKDKGMVIIGVSLDKGGAGQVKDFCEEMNVNYPVVMGDDRVTQKYGGIRGIPTTFVIDRDGVLINKFVGYRPPEVFESQVKELIE